jgi:DNA primase small subunit
MEEKSWQGAELVFDIDADHISTECKNDHDAWVCNNPDCQETGTGAPPEGPCPKCGVADEESKMGFITRSWLCDKCLDVAKEITLRVHDDFLIQDFGIDPSHIQLNFSGHRGYHIRVRDPRVFKLDSRGRVEITNYITGLGFSIAPTKDDSPTERHRVIVVSGNTPLPTRGRKELDVPGWGNRVAEAMIDFIRNIDSYEGTERWVKYFKDNEKYKEIAARNREHAIQDLMRNPPILSPRVKMVGDASWQELAMRAVEAYGGEIDVPVTTDIRRIIRLIGSLHGKTGFSVIPLTRDEIKAFNPLNDSLAITDGTLKIRVGGGPLAVPKIRIGDDTLGPFHNESVELPMAAAVFMLCKGVATIE